MEGRKEVVKLCRRAKDMQNSPRDILSSLDEAINILFPK
jgi:hypothetical protein